MANEAPQTYDEYLETMRAYNFYPMDLALWQSWQDYYNQRYGRVKKMVDHKIPLSEKHGANPSMGVCFWCGGGRNVFVLHGKLPDDEEAPRSLIVDYEACETCKGIMARGFVLIEASSTPVVEGQPMMNEASGAYPTGNWTVVSEEEVKKVFGEGADAMIKNKAAFISKEEYQKLVNERDVEGRE